MATDRARTHSRLEEGGLHGKKRVKRKIARTRVARVSKKMSRRRKKGTMRPRCLSGTAVPPCADLFRYASPFRAELPSSCHNCVRTIRPVFCHLCVICNLVFGVYYQTTDRRDETVFINIPPPLRGRVSQSAHCVRWWTYVLLSTLKTSPPAREYIKQPTRSVRTRDTASGLGG